MNRDFFIGYFPNKSVSFVVAVAQLGTIATLPHQSGTESQFNAIVEDLQDAMNRQRIPIEFAERVDCHVGAAARGDHS